MGVGGTEVSGAKHTLQGHILHVKHMNLRPKVVKDTGLLTCNVPSTHYHHPASIPTAHMFAVFT